MHLSHRPVQPSDIPAICCFPQGPDELFYMFPKATYPLTPVQLTDAIAQRNGSTVVQGGGMVLGFANFYKAEHGGVCALGNVVVAPAARGHGVASYLVTAMIELAREQFAAREIWVSCFNHNTAGLLLYPQLGFVPFGIEERQAPDGKRVALVQMRQVLA
ncbi:MULTISPECIES: GNAT family N-acetyltransferase [Pseudomonas]|jgi:ribosomal protein S18 acetylase RimI-like enzyme|uniref:GNAT family N-acetyltransferase n=1 Tax=Pseudomonas TaxID=286 RepID=UPI000A0EA142|nr:MULTISPECIES: GNAT family N-acetyltransferase [Pseudomonas]ATP43336.1 N-acetyltransferase [Pseudomonas putida]USS56829.1 GNAT family N-acetyltransferase [Pseudomonas kermanshahensis]UVL67723.1 GNAT family N-acetyltransferase [Pseudomonas sp. B21-031]SMF09273.1 Protein N-acetyltransferase, RimJ/RimL family [Pseudomonas sp. LAIL14HWK12:I11]SMR79896.1 Protein N-acetyltransferase, RimJ/RimL family [Pseudomonas sp. LAIL14HWK12:I10]